MKRATISDGDQRALMHTSSLTRPLCGFARKAVQMSEVNLYFRALCCAGAGSLSGLLDAEAVEDALIPAPVAAHPHRQLQVHVGAELALDGAA